MEGLDQEDRPSAEVNFDGQDLFYWAISSPDAGRSSPASQHAEKRGVTVVAIQSLPIMKQRMTPGSPPGTELLQG